ncbi:MAG: DUF4097 family beta strand repeat-containing protein [Gemmatimonadaceae bacterium]
MIRPCRHLFVSAVVAAVSSAGALSAQRTTLAGDSVAIYDIAGRVTIEAGTGNSVEVDMTRGGRQGDKLTVQSGPIRGRETMRVIFPDDRVVYEEMGRGRGHTSLRVRDDGTFNGNDDDRDRGRRVEISSYGSGLDARADLRVFVPRGRRVAIYLGVGEVRATNVDGDLTLDVGAAPVTTKGTRGRLTIDGGSGRIEVSDADGTVSIDAGSGGSTVSRVHGGTLSMDVGSGHVTISDIDVTSLSLDAGSGGVDATGVKASDVSIDAGSGSVDVAILSDIKRLKIDAGSGGVSLRLPKTLSAEVSVETGSGNITTDFEIAVTRSERRLLRGKIGAGDGRITIETGSGGVRLLKN